MIDSLKKFEINEAFKHLINNNNNLLKVLFSDFPKLEKITFSKTQEYNDNDYSDFFTIEAINDIAIVDNSKYDDIDDIDDIDQIDLFDDIEIDHICSIVSSFSDTFEITSEENINRKDFSGDVKKIEETDAFEAYYFASKTNKKIKNLSVFSIFKDSPNWALYYCIDLGHKFEEKEVEYIFCKKNCLKYAYYYALCVLKDRLPNKIEKEFNKIEKKYQLESFEERAGKLSFNEKLDVYYMKKYKKFKESLCTTN